MAKQQSPAPAPEQETSVVGKGRSTPTRREREAARKRPLVPDDRKEARKQERARMQQARERARVGLANGEERYLPVRDRGPQRKFVRDYVDARFSIGEVLIPVMFLVIFITLIPNEAVQVYGMLGLYALITAAILDAVLVGTLVRRKLAAKVGGKDKVEKGLRFYTAMRALQLRPLRLPKPQVKRGQYPS